MAGEARRATSREPCGAGSAVVGGLRGCEPGAVTAAVCELAVGGFRGPDPHAGCGIRSFAITCPR